MDRDTILMKKRPDFVPYFEPKKRDGRKKRLFEKPKLKNKSKMKAEATILKLREDKMEAKRKLELVYRKQIELAKVKERKSRLEEYQKTKSKEYIEKVIEVVATKREKLVTFRRRISSSRTNDENSPVAYPVKKEEVVEKIPCKDWRCPGRRCRDVKNDIVRTPDSRVSHLSPMSIASPGGQRIIKRHRSRSPLITLRRKSIIMSQNEKDNHNYILTRYINE